MNKTILTNKILLKLLLLYRIILAFILEFFIQNITRRGDTPLYLEANPLMLFNEYGFAVFFDRTHLPQFLIGFIHSIVRFEILTHLLFCLLAYYGIWVFLKSIADKNNKYYKILVLLCFFPSFNLWTSVAGKEAIIVFAIGIISAEVVRFFQGEKVRISLQLIVSLFLIFIIKEQYIPAILQLVLYIRLRQSLSLSFKTDIAILVVVFLLNCVVLYLLRNKIDAYALRIHDWFRADARSTRERVFIEQYDFFRKMPYLMPLAMWGPTWEETKISFLHKISFIESGVLLGTLIYMIKDFVLKLFTKFRIYYQWLLLSVNVMGWLFIAQYMQGIMNPGAAVRYRANLHLLIAALCFSLSCVEKIKRNTGEE